MSRVGKKPIKIPEGVQIQVESPWVEVKGKLGSLKREIPVGFSLKVAGSEAVLQNQRPNDKEKNSIYGLTRTLLANMIHGVKEGFTRELELQGVGFRAQSQGGKLTMQVGFSHPVEFALPAGVQANVEANTKIVLKGADKELVGRTAARLRKIRPPEPYKGKGIRYAGEVITLKQGKAAGGSGGGK